MEAIDAYSPVAAQSVQPNPQAEAAPPPEQTPPPEPQAQPASDPAVGQNVDEYA